MPQAPRNRLRIFSAISAILCCAAVISCKKVLPERMEIAHSRPPLEGDDQIPKGITAATRFMDGLPRVLKWQMPAAWKLMPSTQFRDLNFSFGPDRLGECYLSQVTGDVSSLEANLNRWRKQMGQPPYSAEEVAALPRQKFLMQEGPYVDLTGSYQAAMQMDAAMAPPPRQNYRLLAVYVPFVQGGVTIKMTGPAELVAAEKANFEAFCASVEVNRDMLD